MLQTHSFKQNFDQVIKALEIAGIKPTSLANKLGYTTTSQLHSVISGDSIPSIRAVINLIETLKVNPLFLFLGQGKMFMDGSDNNSIDNFQRENAELLIKNSELYDKITSLQNRVDELEKFPGASGVAQRCECHRRPDRGMRVLATILADAWWIALDIARLERGRVEGGREQLHQSVGA